LSWLLMLFAVLPRVSCSISSFVISIHTSIHSSSFSRRGDNMPF
jgi:hypothetical protein